MKTHKFIKYLILAHCLFLYISICNISSLILAHVSPPSGIIAIMTHIFLYLFIYNNIRNNIQTRSNKFCLLRIPPMAKENALLVPNAVCFKGKGREKLSKRESRNKRQDSAK